MRRRRLCSPSAGGRQFPFRGEQCAPGYFATLDHATTNTSADAAEQNVRARSARPRYLGACVRAAWLNLRSLPASSRQLRVVFFIVAVHGAQFDARGAPGSRVLSEPAAAEESLPSYDMMCALYLP